MLDKIIIACFSGILGGVIGSVLSFQFNKRLEKIKREKLIKDKAAVVAELLAKWHSKTKFDAYDCTKLSYELSLYLPAELYALLSNRLANKPDAIDTKEILIKVREHLIGTSDNLKAEKIIHWE